MMTTTREQYSPQFKGRVAMEGIRGDKALSQFGLQFKVHPNADCEVAEGGDRATAGSFRGWPGRPLIKFPAGPDDMYTRKQDGTPCVPADPHTGPTARTALPLPNGRR
jgi:hypothetical protein